MRPDRTCFDRRALIGAGAAAAFAGPQALAATRSQGAQQNLRALERWVGGRLGLAALNTGSNRWLAYRADERFPMCSTFKWLAAAAVLARVDRGVERLDRRIAYSKADLLFNSPTTQARVGEGAMPLGDLCAAAITLSDNGAANLLLTSLGGPAGLTRWLRSIGDAGTRLDRNEPTLNTAIPGDPRDTTKPEASIADLRRILLGKTLSDASRLQLTGWMIANKTGDRRLRAGLPKDWRVGDKTGTGVHATSNDVAIAWPPSWPPILIAAYLTGGEAPDATREAALAEMAQIVVSALGPGR
ncbi:MAG TPA: class A beta-lactamase [Caulobacteraceae bacterium]|jgi:beta-lactamase class A|nr:class A beta-lactamase [Caulobacteraceae bacterium]